jgi:hypothetical protein
MSRMNTEREPREYPSHILPHAECGDPECCGLFFPLLNGEHADIICNECGKVYRSVPAADVEKILDELELEVAFCRSSVRTAGL